MIRGGSVLVRLRWLTDEVEVVLGLPMSLKEEKAKEFALHACRDPVMAGKKEMLSGLVLRSQPQSSPSASIE